MILADFKPLGGRHWETATMRNLLAYHGVVSPVTGEPLSEALCFGIAGGIGLGYSFCPSIPGHGVGSGITVVGRYRVYTTGAAYQQAMYERVGCQCDVRESGGVKAAYKNLVDGLAAGNPVVVWCSHLPLLGFHWCGACGMYLTLVHGVDEDKGEAYLSDRAPSSIPVALEELATIRNGVCSHKNRSLTITPPKKLTVAQLKSAVLAGLESCVHDLLTPKMKTFGPPGVADWAKLVTNAKNQKGWTRVYPGGKLFGALKDVYDSIETAGTGGGLFRPMFAEFLDEAAMLTKKRGLAECAAHYRALGTEWSALAGAALPSKIKPFKRAKTLMNQRRKLLEGKGAKAAKQIRDAIGQLHSLTGDLAAGFPLGDAARAALLEDLQQRITAVHANELAAAGMLRDAVA